jgi:hypothetical protein
MIVNMNRHERRKAAALNGKPGAIVRPFAPVPRQETQLPADGTMVAGFFVGGMLAGALRPIPAGMPVIEATGKRPKLILTHPGDQPFEFVTESYNVHIVQPEGCTEPLALCVVQPNEFPWGMRELMSAYLHGLEQSRNAVSGALDMPESEFQP